MENEGSGDKVLDGLVVTMAVILFFGTAAVMSEHAPSMLSEILGFDTAFIYGVIAAICVEWGALRLHFNPVARRHPVAKWVKWLLLGLSAICQVYNAAIETGTLGNLSDTFKMGFTYLVPNIPLLFIVLMFWIGGLEGNKRRGWLDRLQDKGILGHIPNPKAIFTGRGNTEFSPDEVVQANLDQTNQPPVPVNGKNSGVKNPTNRQP